MPDEHPPAARSRPSRSERVKREVMTKSFRMGL